MSRCTCRGYDPAEPCMHGDTAEGCPVHDPNYEPDDDDGYELGCECEQDWNCPLHANRRGTWLETRYEGMDRDEAFAYGRYEDM